MPLSGNHLFIFLSELYSSNRDISVLRRIWQMDNSQGGSWGRSHLRIGVDVSWSDFSYQIILLFRVSFYIALLRSATEMGVFILMMLGLEWLMRFKQPDSNKTPSRWIFLTLSTILGFYGKLVSLLSFLLKILYLQTQNNERFECENEFDFGRHLGKFVATFLFCHFQIEGIFQINGIRIEERF